MDGGGAVTRELRNTLIHLSIDDALSPELRAAIRAELDKPPRPTIPADVWMRQPSVG